MTLTDKTHYYNIAKFTIPCIIELFLFSMISVVNLAMVGHLGAVALSAVGLTSQPINISLAVFQSFNIGATALIARFCGAKDFNNARVVIIQTLQVAVILSVLISIICFFMAESIIQGMGARADSLPLAIMYMKFMAVGVIFQVVPLAISSLLRGAGDSKTPMFINIVANLINMILGYILIFGKFGVPELGVLGAGISATVAKVISAMLAIILLFHTKLPIKLKGNIKLGFDKDILSKITKIGAASAVEQLILRVGFFLYTRTIADLGTISFAAHQICLNISNLSTNFGHALGMASASFTGRLLGANKHKEIMSYIKKLILIGLGFSLIISILFLSFGQGIAKLYTTDLEVVKVLVPVLLTLAIINPGQNTLLVLSGSLKGAGDTRWPLLTSVVGLTCIRLPLVFLLTKVLGLGINGAWIAAAAEKYISVLFFKYRMKKFS